MFDLIDDLVAQLSIENAELRAEVERLRTRHAHPPGLDDLLLAFAHAVQHRDEPGQRDEALTLHKRIQALMETDDTRHAQVASLRELLDGPAPIDVVRAERETLRAEVEALRARVDGMARNARGTGDVLKAISDENDSLHAQLTRAQRILAVEQGRVVHAPEGWTVRGHTWRKGRLRVRRVGWGWAWVHLGAPGRVPIAAGAADTALEAMELAEASSSAAGEGVA